jgi:hypothetical protein
MAELSGDSVETRMLEVEQAAMQGEARNRLSEIRAQLGIEGPASAAGEVGTGDGDSAPASDSEEPKAGGS